MNKEEIFPKHWNVIKELEPVHTSMTTEERFGNPGRQEQDHALGISGLGDHPLKELLYAPQTFRRIQFLVDFFGGKKWFKDKRILELGCGVAAAGRHLEKFGSIITYSDIDPEREHYIKKLLGEEAKFICINNEKPWDLKEKFDLIIHWGLFYHLKSWERDLEIALKHAPIVSYEGEVMDSNDPYGIAFRKESGPDQAHGGIGTFPSPAFIERHIRSLGKEFTRYRFGDGTYNVKNYLDNIFYGWKTLNNNDWACPCGNQRAYWMIYGEEVKKPTFNIADFLLQDNFFHPMVWHKHPVFTVPPGFDPKLDAYRWELGEIYYEHSTDKLRDDK